MGFHYAELSVHPVEDLEVVVELFRSARLACSCGSRVVFVVRPIGRQLEKEALPRRKRWHHAQALSRGRSSVVHQPQLLESVIDLAASLVDHLLGRLRPRLLPRVSRRSNSELRACLVEASFSCSSGTSGSSPSNSAAISASTISTARRYCHQTSASLSRETRTSSDRPRMKNGTEKLVCLRQLRRVRGSTFSSSWFSSSAAAQSRRSRRSKSSSRCRRNWRPRG